MLTNPAKQLLNWARKAALMNEDDFSKEFNDFSATARKQMASCTSASVRLQKLDLATLFQKNPWYVYFAYFYR